MKHIFRKKRCLRLAGAMDIIHSGEFHPGNPPGEKRAGKKRGKKNVVGGLKTKLFELRTEQAGKHYAGIRVFTVFAFDKWFASLRTGHPQP